MLQVVAGIIESEGKILICRRTASQSHPLQWEFPGGKVESGETPAAALGRELEEELGIQGARGQEITRYEFTYPGKPPVELIFFRVLDYEQRPRNLIFHEMRWEAPAMFARFDFVEGDLEFLRTFAAGRPA
jgi:8-oxo-dGTP diphosphatase